MKKQMLVFLIIFGIGFFGYGLIEILWRGYTHPSMSLAGGISYCIIFLATERLKSLNFLYKCIVGGLIITFVELAFGLLLNLSMNLEIWNYSMIPINLQGQICMLYSVLWCFLSAPIIFLLMKIKKALKFELKYESMSENNQIMYYETT